MKKSINIFGSISNIKITDLEEHQLEGYFDPMTKDIYINKHSEEKFLVYLHEVIHAVFHRLGINQTSMPRDVQEMIAESMANFIDERFLDIYEARKNFKKDNSRRIKKT